MAALPKVQLSPEEYLALDRAASTKSEYIDGEIVAMAGASLEHNLIVANVVGALWGQLRGRSCSIVPSDMRVFVPATGNYVFPDATIVCGEPRLADFHQDILLNPTLIVDVLSDSTEAYDRGAKFKGYRTIAPLQEYILVAQDKPLLERYVRQPNGDWTLTEFSQPDAVVNLVSVGCQLPLAEVYDRVTFETLSP